MGGGERLCTYPKGRRKTIRGKWYFEPDEANVWVQNDILFKMTYKRLDGREDEPQAALAGIRTKLLMRPGVEKHFGDFDVVESASCTQIN